VGRVTLAAVIILGLLLAASPARAQEAPKPIIQKATDRGILTVVVEAPHKAYGLRLTARYIDRRVAGLRIRSGLDATCIPDATCIRLDVEHGRSVTCGWFTDIACAQIGGNDPFFKVTTFWGSALDRGLMCHEFLHTLGLQHHDRAGCLGRGDHKNPSSHELGLLRQLYG
jgi:hypothetical protein